MPEINFHPFPVLTTERLVLREITQADVNELFVLRSDERIQKYLDREPAKSTEDAARFIQMITDAHAANEHINWGIALKDDPKLIGNICFWRIELAHYRAEIGYTLHPDMQNKGIMKEAIKAALDYGFGVMGLHSVEANVNPENAASIAVLERNGFVREGYFKENYFYNGRFIDSAIYSLLTPVR